MRGWGTSTVLRLIKCRRTFWLFQHNCPFCSVCFSVEVLIKMSTMYNRPQARYFSWAVTVNLQSKEVNDPLLCLLQHAEPEFWVSGDAHSQSLVWSFCSSFISSNKIYDYSVLTLMCTSSKNKTLHSVVTILQCFCVWKFPDALIVFLIALGSVKNNQLAFFFFSLTECLVSAADVHLHPLVIPCFCILNLEDTSLLSS